MASVATRACIGLGMCAVAVHFLLHNDSYVYESVGLISGVLILGATAYRRPRSWLAWAVMGVSQLVMGFGDVIYNEVTTAYPGPADVVYLTGDALLVSALVLFALYSASGTGFAAHLDALIVAVAIGIAVWPVVFAGSFDDRSVWAAVVGVAYPVADLLVLGVLVRFLFFDDRRTSTFWLLVVGVVLLFVSDSAYAIPALEGTYAGTTTWLDAGWLGSYVFFAAAALHPTMGNLVNRRHTSRDLPSLRRGLVLGGALLAAPAVTIVAELSGRDVAVAPVLVAVAALLILVIVRFASIVRELDRSRLRAEDSERKFRMIFERAPIGISVGRDGMMSETNPAFQRMLGYTGEEFARMHYTAVTDPDEAWLQVQNELDEGRRDLYSIDKRLLHKDGRVVETHVQVALDLDDGLGISLIADVTDRLALEDQLRQSQKMEAIGKLAGGIAHDFNNLMTAVIGYSDLLLMQFDDREGDDRRRSKVDAIRDSAVRAADLTRQLLAFSRRQILKSEDVDLCGVVERMDTLLHRLIGEDILLETIFGSEEVIVGADRTQLEQVVMNLAVNARDAMRGGGTLTIVVRSDGESAILSVTDDGFGMDAATIARIYEPFFTTKPVGEGTGLGLSTVHGIVGQSGGTIEVESAPGEGTRFTIRLPLARPAAVLPVAAVPATLVD
jgi:PAS domain S-box-containing protein